MENLQSRLLLLTIKVLPKVDLGPLATVLSPHPLGDQEQRFKTLVPTSRAPHLPLGVDMGEPGAGKERRVGVGRPCLCGPLRAWPLTESSVPWICPAWLLWGALPWGLTDLQICL